MTAISTVRIKSADTASGFIIVNEADFDPSRQTLWEPPRTPRRPPPLAGASIPLGEAEKIPERMTLAEMRDYAKTRGIPIPAAITAKADVLAHVLAADANHAGTKEGGPDLAPETAPCPAHPGKTQG